MFAMHLLCCYGVQGDCEVYNQLLAERMPAIAAHFEALGLSDVFSLFLPRWLLCLFLNCFPVEITVRVWDCLVMEGREVRPSCERGGGGGAGCVFSCDVNCIAATVHTRYLNQRLDFVWVLSVRYARSIYM